MTMGSGTKVPSWRDLILPEEDRRGPRVWNGGRRWFRSANIVDLWDHRAAPEKQRIIDSMWRRRLETAARYRVTLFDAC